MEMGMKAGRGSAAVFAVAFCMVFYLAWLVPMHSDDFSYANMGLAWANHVTHYTHWSGRFLADYISALILYVDSPWVTAALKAFATVAAIAMIARIPAVWLGTPAKTDLLVFLLALYLAGNLILGETVLWTVGAANYLFPVFFAILYLFLFSLYCNRPQQRWRYFVPLVLTGVLAGCSNENTGWVMVAATLAGALYLHWQRKDRAVWLLLIPVLLGFGVLLLSPGNVARAAQPAFAEFYQTRFFERVLRFTFSGGFPKSVAKLLPFWGVAAMLLILGRRAANAKVCRRVAVGVIVCALASAYSMVMSPTFPSRALGGPVFLMLIAVAFAYTPLLDGPSGRFLRWRGAFIVAALLAALLMYVAMIFSYQRVALQEQVRQALVRQAVAAGQESTVIPAFFYPPSLRKGDAVDSYHNDLAMGEYYGMQDIQVVPLDYDYSVLLDGVRYDTQPGTASGDGVFDALYLGRSNLLGSTTLVLGGPLSGRMPEDIAQLRVVMTLRDGRQESRLLPWVPVRIPDGVMMGGRVPVSQGDIAELGYTLIQADGSESPASGTFLLH